MADLGFDCVVVGRKGFAFEDDLVAVFGRTVEGRHEQVEVGRERFHHGYFAGESTDYLGALREGRIIDVDPWRNDRV